MVILFRRLARSALLLSALLLSCMVALLMVMRGPLHKLTLATSTTDNMRPPVFPTIHGIQNLFPVEIVALQNWRADSMQNFKVPELKGKKLIRNGQTIPLDYSVANRLDSQVKM